jgi:hypothetical protein
LTLTIELWLFLAVATSFVAFLGWLAVVGDLIDAVPPSDHQRVVRRLRVLAWLGLVQPFLGVAAWDGCRLYAERSGVAATRLTSVTRVAVATSALSCVGALAVGAMALQS